MRSFAVPTIVLVTFACLVGVARAQTCIGPGGSEFLNSTCGGSTIDTLGAFGFGGPSFRSGALGFGISIGAFHQHLFGVEAGAVVPIYGGKPGEARVVVNALARVTPWRDGIGAPWEGTLPDYGYFLSWRTGIGICAGTESLFAVVFGPTAELIVNRTILLGLRPTLALAKIKNADTGIAEWGAMPSVDLTVGSLSPGAYGAP